MSPAYVDLAKLHIRGRPKNRSTYISTCVYNMCVNAIEAKIRAVQNAQMMRIYVRDPNVLLHGPILRTSREQFLRVTVSEIDVRNVAFEFGYRLSDVAKLRL